MYVCMYICAYMCVYIYVPSRLWKQLVFLFKVQPLRGLQKSPTMKAPSRLYEDSLKARDYEIASES